MDKPEGTQYNNSNNALSAEKTAESADLHEMNGIFPISASCPAKPT